MSVFDDGIYERVNEPLSALSHRLDSDGSRTGSEKPASPAWPEAMTHVGVVEPFQQAAERLLRKRSGMAQKQAAELLDMSERTVRRRVQTARLAINEAMQGEQPPVD